MFRMNLCLVFFPLIWVTVSATHADDCGSKIGSFSVVEVSGCSDNNHECVLRKRTNVTLHITFTTNEAVQSVKAVVHGIVQGIPVPFSLPDGDACKTSLQCPLSAGTTYNYTAQLPVKKYYPSVQVKVKWELQNEKEEDIVCCIIPARIR
ncbi:ecdysteroid-regulated 16 kDa protein [Bacillus rossius redtenbacheri]|uniref:ecdysteroid-regulated 16 kDa protein n=1 Tax=Bacillus rossius redtenbacheri TaxID=93214 RepID=UPI002FDDAE70